MTLEINEISIQISVRPQAAAPSVPAARNPSPGPGLHGEQMEQLVQRCVREVLRHLRLRERR